jgi:hypothetical protein
MQFIHTLQTLLIVVAVFALPYCIIALIVRSRGTQRTLWATCTAYTMLLSAGCIYKLSGLAWGTFDVQLIVYYLFVSAVSLGFPLATSAIVLHRAHVPALSRTLSPQAFLRPLLFAWLAAIAVTPLATAGVFAVDHFFVRPA